MLQTFVAKTQSEQKLFFSVLDFYRTQVSLVRSLCPDVRHWVSELVSPTPCVDLTDVTLADEDTNPILTDDANRAIHNNVATQVTQPLQTMQVAPPVNKVESVSCHIGIIS